MDKKRNVPEIRFAGFADDWEQRKLGEIYGKIRNAFVGTATPYYVDQGYFYLESNNVKNGQINRNTEVFINEAFYYAQKDKWLKENDLVMVQSGHVGHTAVIPKELNNTAAHALITFSDYLEDADPHFLNYLFQTTLAKLEIEKITTGNTIKHILSSDMKEFQIKLPKYKEQTTIGNFFKQLDETIALHQREYEKYKHLKISYLEKMFPKENEQFPELRFPEFTDAWEQRKLGEIADIRRGASPRPIQSPIWFDKNSDIGWLRISDVTEQNGKIYKLEQKLSSQGQKHTLVLTKPHLILSIAATVGKPVINYIPIGIHDGFIVFLNLNADMEFLYQWLNYFQDNWKNFGQSGSQLNINSDLVRNLEISLPNLEEQTAIGNFFKQLDETIALHQREVEKYKQIKQSYLEKMFI